MGSALPLVAGPRYRVSAAAGVNCPDLPALDYNYNVVILAQ